MDLKRLVTNQIYCGSCDKDVEVEPNISEQDLILELKKEREELERQDKEITESQLDLLTKLIKQLKVESKINLLTKMIEQLECPHETKGTRDGINWKCENCGKEANE